jgi:hypothetical protein
MPEELPAPFLEGPAVKVLLWATLLLGLLSPAFLTYACHGFLGLERSLQPHIQRLMVSARSPQTHVHDAYFQIQIHGIRLSFYPRYWATYLVLAGGLMIVLGTFVILHVPLACGKIE